MLEHPLKFKAKGKFIGAGAKGPAVAIAFLDSIFLSSMCTSHLSSVIPFSSTFSTSLL